MGKGNWLKGVTLASVLAIIAPSAEAQAPNVPQQQYSPSISVEEIVDRLGPWAEYMTSTANKKIFSNTVRVRIRQGKKLASSPTKISYDPRDDEIVLSKHPPETPELFGKMAYAFSKAFTDTIGTHGLYVSPHFTGPSPDQEETAQFLEERHLGPAYREVRNTIDANARRQGRRLLLEQYLTSLEGVIDLYKTISKDHPARGTLEKLTDDYIQATTVDRSTPDSVRKATLFPRMRQSILELQTIYARLDDIISTLENPKTDAIRTKLSMVWEMSPTRYQEETHRRLSSPQERLARDLEDLYSLNLESGRIDEELLDFLQQQKIHGRSMHGPQIRKARLGLEMMQDGQEPKTVQEALISADTYTYKDTIYDFSSHE